MIVLKVEDYCHGCPAFDVEMHKSVGMHDYIDGYTSHLFGDIVLTCSRAETCGMIKNYLERNRI